MSHPQSIRRTIAPGRRLRLAGAALCASALLLAGCASANTGNGTLGNIQNAPGPGGTAPVAGLSGAPSAGATSTPAATSTPTATPSTPATSAAPPPYPSDYAQAILAAWAAHSHARLTLLMNATDATHLLAIGDPDRHWTSVMGAGGAAGSSYPTYYNNSGDYLVLQLNNQDLATRTYHAGRLNLWDPITYPNDASAYTKEFVNGWINGNKARMIKLSSASVTSQFLALTTPDFSYTMGAAPGGSDAGHEYIEVKEASVSLDATLKVADPLLGGAHAIEACYSGC